MFSKSNGSDYSHFESKEFLKFLVSQSKSIVSYFEPIWSQDLIVDFELKFISDSIKNYGLNEPSEILGKNVSEVFPEVLENGAFEIWKACYNKDNLPIEYNRQFNLGQEIYWFKNTAERHGDGVLVVSDEVSELMHAKIQLETLHRQLEFQNTIMNDSQKSFNLASYRWVVGSEAWDFSININSLFTSCNEEDLKKSGIHAILNKQEYGEFMSKINDSIEKGFSQMEPLYFSRKQKNGDFRHFVLTGNFMPVTQGHLLVGIIQDNSAVIENRISLEKKNLKLELMNEELDSFNHVASHDLQEPIRKIRMFISRLQEDGLERISERDFQYIEKIDASAIRMQELIHQLLNYSKIGKKDLGMETVNLNNILEEVQIELEEKISACGAQMDVDNNLPSIEGVPILIRQLFVNLISNAVKYQKQGNTPKIRIWVAQKDNNEKFSKDSFIINVQDNGIGFDHKNIDTIFGLFKRLHSKSEYPGTGIGLAICKKIVEYHKGDISAHSELGKGSIFTIILPKKLRNIRPH